MFRRRLFSTPIRVASGASASMLLPITVCRSNGSVRGMSSVPVPGTTATAAACVGMPTTTEAPRLLRFHRSSCAVAAKATASLTASQRQFFSWSTMQRIRVRGGGQSLENIYSPTQSSSSSSRESELDSLTPFVRQHLLRVYSALGLTCAMAGLGSLLMIATPIGHAISPGLIMIASFVPLLWLSFAPPSNPAVKTALLLSFGLLAGMSIAPLVLMSSMKGVLLTSLMLTAAIFGGFSASAYLAPRGSMVAWQGPLFGGLLGLMGLSLFSIFYPTAIAHSLILYGGLALFSVMVAADTQAMIERARCGAVDHIQDAMSMFLNVINIFVRIMQIMGKD